MTAFVWPNDGGWPYMDDPVEEADTNGEPDDDLLTVLTDKHLLDTLTPTERQVVVARFGLQGHRVRSVKQLHQELGFPTSELRQALGSGLQKLRYQLRP